MKPVGIGLVLSAGGMFAAWEAGVWKTICTQFDPAVVVGASAGAWNGWAIAGGCSPDQLIAQWMDRATAQIMRIAWHRSGCMRPEALYSGARELFARYRPRVPFGLTLSEIPRLRPVIVSTPAITWKHLAATASIPLCFPPVEIGGKLYVDGGLLGALPLWAAEAMGATRVLALNVLTALPFRVLRTVTRPRRPSAALETILVEPSESLGSIRDACVWSEKRIERWIRIGERDGERALELIGCAAAR